MMALLESFPNLRRLSLHGNRLRALPTDLSRLKCLQRLDISNNIFPNVPMSLIQIDDIVTSLQYVPRLNELSCNIRKEEEAKVLQRMPQLEVLNGNIVRKLSENRASQASNRPAVATLSERDIEDVGVLFDRIVQLYRDNDIEVDQEISDFEDIVETVIKDLSRKIKEDKSAEEYVTKVRVVCAKYALNDFCFTKLIGMFGVTDEKIEGVLEKIHNAHAELFREAAELVLYKQFVTEEKEFSLHIKQKLKLYEGELERMRKHRDELVEEIAELTR